MKENISSAEVKSNASGELIFSLPAVDSKSFGSLFESLENNKSDLDIGNFGLSPPTQHELEAEGGGLLGLALLSLRLRSDQSGLGRWCRFWMGVFFFFSWNAR